MEILKELVDIIAETERKHKKLGKAAKSVYHRDYVKTKNKSYRKYTPGEYARRHHESE